LNFSFFFFFTNVVVAFFLTVDKVFSPPSFRVALIRASPCFSPSPNSFFPFSPLVCPFQHLPNSTFLLRRDLFPSKSIPRVNSFFYCTLLSHQRLTPQTFLPFFFLVPSPRPIFRPALFIVIFFAVRPRPSTAVVCILPRGHVSFYTSGSGLLCVCSPLSAFDPPLRQCFYTFGCQAHLSRPVNPSLFLPLSCSFLMCLSIF